VSEPERCKIDELELGSARGNDELLANSLPEIAEKIANDFESERSPSLADHFWRLFDLIEHGIFFPLWVAASAVMAITNTLKSLAYKIIRYDPENEKRKIEIEGKKADAEVLTAMGAMARDVAEANVSNAVADQKRAETDRYEMETYYREEFLKLKLKEAKEKMKKRGLNLDKRLTEEQDGTQILKVVATKVPREENKEATHDTPAYPA